MKKISLLVLILSGINYFISAQVTTSSISGKVIDVNNEAIIGATVRAIHEPSGTFYGGVTNVDGRYTTQGMRSGGPYKVEISYIGAETTVFTDVILELGTIFILDAQLKESNTELGEVVVTGNASKFTRERTGPSTNINNEQMRLLPTISRSIQDIARLSPYANGMSFAGGDGRSTNFTVDGANFNNNFGLSSSLPGGGNPISLDAIEEIQVVIAPFDVRQTNFIGGGINAITKSGTNTLKASAYTYFRNQDMRGNRIDDHDFGERDKESRTIYGVSIGGPIVKNKLFFFGNLEYEKSPQQVVTWRASTDGVSDNSTISRTTEADLKKVSEHLKNKYGYDTGSYSDFPADESNLKYLLRLDWNINHDHKFSVRYNHTKNTSWFPPNGNSNDNNPRSPDGRISKSSMSYANSMYSQDNSVNTISGELNSRFGSKISNQLLGTYSNIQDVRGSNSDPFPFIDIMGGDLGDEVLTSYIAAGYELFTWNNGVTNKVTTVTDNFTVYMDAHRLTAGISYEHQFADNIYMREGTGYYRYASVSDFLNNAAPVDFALTYGTNGVSRPANAVAFAQVGFYVQDEWDVLDNLKLTAGVRGDNLSFLNDMMTNNAILDLDFGGRKINTGVWPKSRINWSPRFGFTWDAKKDKSIIVRGGTGLFMGRLPLVFFTNMPTNAGMTQQLYTISSKYTNSALAERNPALNVFEGGMATTVDEMINKLGINTTVTPEDGRVGSAVAAVDPDFKMPQVWKSALAVDFLIPVSFPFTATAEAMYTKNINAVILENYAVKSAESSSWERFSGADNRYIYPSDFYYNNLVTGTTNVLRDAAVLTNTDEGYGYTLNLTLKAQPAKNLDLMAAYTHTEMKEVSGMPGSNASSAWTGLHTVNGPNLAEVQRSQYVVPDQVIGSISYILPDLAYKATTISLFYRGYSSGGYSYMYANDMNGDGIGNDLMYIPKAKGDIKFASQNDENAFFAFMEQDSYLSNHKGEYAEAYAARAPWVHKFDLRFLQNFNVKAGKTTNTLQLSLDMLNVGNMLNSKWGISKNMSGSNNGRILNYDGKDANNVPIFSMRKVNDKYPTNTYDFNLNYGQCWSLQVGVRYIFN